MKIIKIGEKGFVQAQIDTICDCLLRGGVVVLPTDTIYGLHALANNDEAVNRIRRIKGSSLEKVFVVLVSDLEMLRQYAVVDMRQELYLHKLWLAAESARPTSVVLESRGLLAASLESRGSLALRLPKDDFLSKIIRGTGMPLISTSVNRSGETAMNSVLGIVAKFGNEINYIVDGGELGQVKASKLIDIRNVDDIKILRK